MSDHRRCDACGKVCYRGKHEARLAHRAAHYRIRVYWCEDGRTFHVTNGEKSNRHFSRGDDSNRRQQWPR